MRAAHPFLADDLAELDERLLSRASAVVPLADVHAGAKGSDVIGLRHDLDAGHALATAVRLAEWEAARGYRSSYYILHSAPYWGDPFFRESLDRIAICGHEIGIHANALAEALRSGRDPDLILDDALETLRGYGHTVTGVAGHGDGLCNRDRAPDEPTFVNDEQFLECARPGEGAPDRLLTRGSRQLRLAPRPLADFGLDYEALRLGLPRPWRTSDSGGAWWFPFSETVAEFERALLEPDGRQLHLLMHPDWWPHAFHPDWFARERILEQAAS